MNNPPIDPGSKDQPENLAPGWKPTPVLMFLVSSILLFGALVADLLARGRLFWLDSRVLQLTEGIIRPGLTPVMLDITVLGSRTVIAAVWVFIAIYLCFRKQWRNLYLLVLAYGGGELVIFLLKLIYHRPRPFSRLAEAHGSSFPSGHAFNVMLLCGFLTYLIWRQVAGKRLRLALSALLGFLVLAVGLSRVYLQAHWLSDVLAGYLAGFAWLLLSLLLVNYLGQPRGISAAHVSSP